MVDVSPRASDEHEQLHGLEHEEEIDSDSGHRSPLKEPHLVKTVRNTQLFYLTYENNEPEASEANPFWRSISLNRDLYDEGLHLVIDHVYRPGRVRLRGPAAGRDCNRATPGDSKVCSFQGTH